MSEALYLERARLLLAQGRFAQAAEQLQMLLSTDPNQWLAHALLACCWMQDADRLGDATAEAQLAIALAPDQSFTHSILATVCSARKHFDQAQAAIETAISIDPDVAAYHGIQASIFLQTSKWQLALESSERGLQFDPDQEDCLASRSLALERLGRRKDSLQQANEAVARDPDSSSLHAMRGWTLLHDNNYREAQISFREALRLEPTNSFARSGMLESLKSNYFLFRVFFQYQAFMSRLQGRFRFALIIGIYLLIRALNIWSDANPKVEPFILPITIAYIAFCLFSWIADPIFDALLRFNRFGRYLLSANQVIAANVVIAIIGLAVITGSALAIYGDFAAAFTLALCVLFLTLPSSMIFRVSQGWPQWIAVGSTIVMSLLCAISLLVWAFPVIPWIAPIILYAFCLFVFSLAGNWLTSIVIRK